jgi:(p)ppGpp synthase/HD superfamily hydrolase
VDGGQESEDVLVDEEEAGEAGVPQRDDDEPGAGDEQEQGDPDEGPHLPREGPPPRGDHVAGDDEGGDDRTHRALREDGEAGEEVEGEKEKKRLSSQLFDSLRPQRKIDGAHIAVKGVDDVLVRFARCCNPIPGDEIVGYITRGKGITVHAANCPNLMTLQLEPERQIEVEWETDNPVPMPVKLLVETEDSPGILAEITTAISKQGVNIEEGVLKTDSSRKRGILKFTVDVKNTDQLDAVLHSVRRIHGVIFVNRVLS